ncbi:histidine kinase [uncultured Subdoligranulum sp.]|uniref:sensor histidine kinase n=1 Tax=uncultured Subdoligranulum sp. TaxID=512298 RepID=UPI0026150887|nr:histidine kinase [uncultured Subdoligranulum sp.]
MRRKMLLSYITILLAFCAVTFVFVLRTVYSMVQTNLIETSSQTMQRWSTELSNAMAFARSHMLNLASNQHLQELLITYGVDADSPEGAEQAGEALLGDEALTSLLGANSVTLGTLPFLMEITVRTPDGSYLPVYDTLGFGEESPAPYDPRSEWVQTLESLQGRILWDTYYDGNYEYIRVSKVIYDNRDFSTILGTISVEFNYEHLTQSILNNLRNESGMQAALYDGENGEFVGYYSVRDLPDAETIRQMGLTGSYTLLPDGSVCLFARRLSTTNYYLVGSKSLEEVHDIYLKSSRILFLSAGVALVVGMLLTFLVTGSVMRPVVQLSDTMKNVKNGDLDITVHTREKGEVGELYDSFNYMIQMINQLIEENYVTRLNQKQSELNALQSQINTHFLYNTLDSINWLAKDYHVEQISKLVTSLSTLLRTSLNNGQPELTVEQELTHMRSYLNIQKVRFGGLFQVHEEVDERLLQDTVIKMLLQPLVENAILHAFNISGAPAEGNLLLVRVYLQQQDLVMEVANNAPKDALARVQERLHQETGVPPKSYGIQSIRTRLDIAYAHEAALEYAMDGGFLVARIRIPRRYTAPDRIELPQLKE